MVQHLFLISEAVTLILDIAEALKADQVEGVG